MRHLIVAMALSMLGCGGASTASSTSASTPASTSAGASSAATEPVVPEDAVAFVRMLRAIAAGTTPGALEDHVDTAFGHRLPSGDELGPLLTMAPEGCDPVLEEGPGYGVIAIPPPMDDDSEEDVARIEAIIDELSASTEVTATCTVTEVIDDHEVRGETLLWAVAVRREADGRFVALAWRDVANER